MFMFRLIARALVIVVGFAVFVITFPASATHEVDHRYIVHGMVTDAEGDPVVEERVRLSGGDDTTISEAFTDEHGRYRIVLHVHNDDLGKVFDIVVREDRRKVKILFNTSDRRSERGAEVNFVISP